MEIEFAGAVEFSVVDLDLSAGIEIDDDSIRHFLVLFVIVLGVLTYGCKWC